MSKLKAELRITCTQYLNRVLTFYVLHPVLVSAGIQNTALHQLPERKLTLSRPKPGHTLNHLLGKTPGIPQLSHLLSGTCDCLTSQPHAQYHSLPHTL